MKKWEKVAGIRSDGIALSCFSVIYGVTIYVYPKILEEYQVYGMIRDVFDSHKIGLVFIVLGLGKLIGIATNMKWLRTISLRLLTFLWTFFLIAFIITPPPNSVWIMAALFIYLIYQATREEKREGNIVEE